MPHIQEVTNEVVLGAQQGDLAFFEQIVSAYENAIYHYIFRLVRHQQEAEDLTQETFLKLYKKFSTYNSEKPFRPWLFGIATHAVQDWWRKRQRQREDWYIRSDDDRLETISEPEAYISIEQVIDLDSALATLQPKYRMVLLLYYNQQLTYEQIADITAVPINTVKTHLYRAKRALQDAYLKPPSAV